MALNPQNDGLSVELPVKPQDEESSDEEPEIHYNNDNKALELDLDKEQEDNTETKALPNEIGDKIGLNSPKNMDTKKDSNQLGLNLDENTVALDTPTIREKIGINSPRKSEEFKKKGWTGAEPDKVEEKIDSSGNRIITNDNKNNIANNTNKINIEDLVTQVPRDNIVQKIPDNEEEHETHQTEEKLKQNNGWKIFSCFQCLCCISQSSLPHQILTENQQATQREQEIAITPIPEVANNIELSDNDATPIGDEEPSESHNSTGLLKSLLPEHLGKKCLVLDLDETLVHSSFKSIPFPDIIVPIEIDNVLHKVYVLKRPHVDEFLLRASKHYELVVFTASVAKYADPLLDVLDTQHTITHRLFRESCVLHGSIYVKDLTKLGRKLKETIIVDNSPQSYLFQPKNAIPIATWFDDPNDKQLLEFLPVLETTLKNIDDVRKVLDANTKSFKWLCNQANKPLESFQ